jgi:DNA modification methylase
MFVLTKGTPKVCNQIKDKKNKQSGKTITGNYRDIDGSLKEMSGSKNKREIKEKGVRWNIWQYNTGWKHSYTEEFLRGHPAIFPEKLAHDHIISWSNEGDTILDPMAGSGTTLKMAKKNNRNYIGIEISQEYIDIINKRLL